MATMKTIRSWTLFSTYDKDDQKVRTIRVSVGDAVWQLSDVHESHDPADRVGGPYRLQDLVEDDIWGDWYVFSIVDSYFPPSVLVRAHGEDAAWDAFAEWCTETVSEENPSGRYGLVVTADEQSDYDEDSSSVVYAGGHMVDMESVTYHKAAFHSCEV